MKPKSLLKLLTENHSEQNTPDALGKHYPSPIYIRALITRARVVNRGLKREQVAEKCGTSLSSLNKYTKPYDNTPCPYVMQHALERLAGISSCERASVFRVEMSVNNSDLGFFRAFDEFRSNSMVSSLISPISVLIVLTEEEAKEMEKGGVALEKQEI